MDYTYLKDKDLYRNLYILSRRCTTARKKLKTMLNIYGRKDSWADVVLQSNKEIGLLERLRDELDWVQRNAYYYRPTHRKYDRILLVCRELSESRAENRKHGRNDIRKDLDDSKKKEAEALINSALDDIEDILLAPGVLHELNTRRGLYENYIGDRLWQVIVSVTLALLTGIIGLLTGIILA